MYVQLSNYVCGYNDCLEFSIRNFVDLVIKIVFVVVTFWSPFYPTSSQLLQMINLIIV